MIIQRIQIIMYIKKFLSKYLNIGHKMNTTLTIYLSFQLNVRHV